MVEIRNGNGVANGGKEQNSPQLEGIIASVSEEDEAERRRARIAASNPPPTPDKGTLKTNSKPRSRFTSFFRTIFCCVCTAPIDSSAPVVSTTNNASSGALVTKNNINSNNSVNNSSHNSTDFAPDNNPITSVSPAVQRPNTSQQQGTLPIPPVGNNGALVPLNGSPNNQAVQKKVLLKPILPEDVGKKCLVLDLDETLVHSCFKPVAQADFVVPVEIENQIHNVYVTKRPGVDAFMKKMGESFEVVVFTASLAKYADPVLDMLDKHKVVRHRLFREACINHKGNYVKDLSMLGRELRKVIIIDNSPASYIFHPENALPISSWFSDQSDTELLDLIPFLMDLTKVDDVCAVLDQTQDERRWNQHRK